MKIRKKRERSSFCLVLLMDEFLNNVFYKNVINNTLFIRKTYEMTEIQGGGYVDFPSALYYNRICGMY